LLSAAKVDALVHAAKCGCEVAIPLIQLAPTGAGDPPGELTVRCPAGCGADLSVPIVVTETQATSAVDGETSNRFTAEAPELHHYINQHLRICPSSPLEAAAALEQAHS
jgi:hypothetical protein